MKTKLTVAQKIEKINALDKSFAFRLAAICATDTNKGNFDKRAFDRVMNKRKSA